MSSRPRLQTRTGIGSAVAGGLALPVAMLGLAVGLVGLAAVFVRVLIAVVESGVAALLRSMFGGSGAAPAGPTISDVAPGAVIAGLGIVVIAVAAVVSWLILQRSGHPHPAGVTFAALGLGVVASFVLTAVANRFHATRVDLGTIGDDVPAAVGSLLHGLASGAVVLVPGLVVLGAVGSVLWWAMAVAMRPPVPVDPTERISR